MSELFECTLIVGWEHLDMNAHVKNTAYLDFAVNARMMYFQTQSFTMREFERLRVGPVVRRDEMEYFREFRMLESVRVTLALAGLSADASRFTLCNEFFRADGKLAARLSSTGGWLDLNARKLILPPEPLARALHNLARTRDFQTLDSSIA